MKVTKVILVEEICRIDPLWSNAKNKLYYMDLAKLKKFYIKKVKQYGCISNGLFNNPNYTGFEGFKESLQ